MKLTLAPKPTSFKKDSLDLLLTTQSELLPLKLRVDEARTNPITDRELETAIALTGLKVIELENRLRIYNYHHGETKDYAKVKEELDSFLTEHDELMNEFHYWLMDARV
jgi:hypothetical protein